MFSLLRNSIKSVRLSRLNIGQIGKRLAASSAIASSEVDYKNRYVKVSWNDRTSSRNKSENFPITWLRDNCQCSSCWDKSAKARCFIMPDLDPKIKAKEIGINSSGQLSVHWEDGHKSTYSKEWLLKHSFSKENQAKRASVYGAKKHLWNAEYMQSRLPKYDFQRLLKEDRYLYQWLKTIDIFGVSIINNAPEKIGQLQKIGSRCGLLRESNYGITFQVKNKTNASNLAYTGGRLGLHLDLGFYDYQQGLQMLHCIKQTKGEGGENEIVDGFHVAMEMKKNHPKEFQILSTQSVDIKDIGKDYYEFHHVKQQVPIRLNNSGFPNRITYTNHLRDEYLNLKAEQVQDFYDAWKLFDDLIYSKENCVLYKMTEGDILCLDNHRVLHGRTALGKGHGGTRHLEGAYIEWDVMHSKIRILREQLGITDE